MKMKIRILITIIFYSITGHTQVKKDSLHKTYEFNIYDGSESFTMHQFSKNYLSSYRIFSRTIDELIPNKKVKMIVKLSAISLFGLPYTHEEGHRSVLTSKGIGSISQPFFGSNGAAYVKGVKDIELINLRMVSPKSFVYCRSFSAKIVVEDRCKFCKISFQSSEYE